MSTGAPTTLDRIDRAILRLLQHDATLTVGEVAERVGLSQTPCWRRIQRLEEAGIIARRVALLDAAKLGLGLTVFVAIRTDKHEQSWLDRFAAAARDFEEIQEIHRLTGEIDYLMRVVVPDIAAYDAFYKRLIAAVPLSDVTSSFSMEAIKSTTELPIPKG